MRSNKWLILGLVVSVGVNIAMAGYLAGRASHGPALRHIDSTVGFMRVLRNLDAERREQLQPLVRGPCGTRACDRQRVVQ